MNTVHSSSMFYHEYSCSIWACGGSLTHLCVAPIGMPLASLVPLLATANMPPLEPLYTGRHYHTGCPTMQMNGQSLSLMGTGREASLAILLIKVIQIDLCLFRQHCVHVHGSRPGAGALLMGKHLAECLVVFGHWRMSPKGRKGSGYF